MFYHILHFFSGFILLPEGHLKTSENSFIFEREPITLETKKQTNKQRIKESSNFISFTYMFGLSPLPPPLVTGEFLSISLRVYVPVISQGMSVCCCQFIGSWRSKCTAPHLSRMKDFPCYLNIPQNVPSLWSYWLKNDELVTFLSRKRMEYGPFPIWGGGGGRGEWPLKLLPRKNLFYNNFHILSNCW